MNASTESQPSGNFDTLKWILIFLCLATAVGGNYAFAELSGPVRAIGVILIVLVAGFVAITTDKGRIALAFAKEARTEVRKVVWPTRQEAMQTTFIVLAATFVMSLVLWGLDSTLFWLVGLVTGLQV